mmetsp:Transcript_8066/g.6028  ORF Transcript_8066/g.6028 Transcript_8066/m.6028 type:complete len:87 (+) Transcript_8066:262-522(+)
MRFAQNQALYFTLLKMDDYLDMQHNEDKDLIQYISFLSKHCTTLTQMRELHKKHARNLTEANRLKERRTMRLIAEKKKQKTKELQK